MRIARLIYTLLLVLATPSIALAAPTKEQLEEAQKHFFKGTDLYEESDWANAAIEYKRAYEIAPEPTVLFNIGQACYQAADYACALDAFQRYLTDAGTKVPAKRRADLEKDIKKLQGRVAKVEIATNVPGAVITIDDEKKGTTPLSEALTLSQGKRKITATKDGYEPNTQVVEIAGGEAKKIDITLKEVEKTPPPPPPQTKVVRKSSPLPYIGVGVTGALLVTTVITGIVAINASDKANNRLNTFGSNPNEIKSLESDASTFALVTDILGAVTIAAGVTTAILFILDKPKTEEKPGVAILPGGLRATFY